MKNKIITGLMIFIVIIALYEIKVEATFKITNFEINCNVQENGDIDIEENIKYYTDENKNGLIRKIETKNNMNSINSADEIILKSVQVDGVEYEKIYNAAIGDSGVYTYTNSGNSNTIKVFTPFRSNSKNITYMYKLKNVAVKYNDIAELYWNFIGSEWDCEIERLNINIILPNLAQKGTIYVYGHGSDNGNFTKSGNYIILNANQIKPYQAIDARILFPTTVLSKSNKIIDKDVLDKYINQEEGMKKHRESEKVLLGLSVNEIALGISVIILIVGIIIYYKYDKEYKVEKYKYYREIPYDLEPEILQRIYYGKQTKNAFWVTFLNLVRKGVFRIEKTTNEVGKETEILYFEKDIENLKPYQNKVKQEIKSYMSTKENSIDILKLQSEMKLSLLSRITFRTFQKNIETEMEGLFGETKKVPKRIIIMLAISMAILIAIITILSTKVVPKSGIQYGIPMFLGFIAFVYSKLFATITFNFATTIFFSIHCGIFQLAIISMLAQTGIAIMYIPYALLFILIQYVVRVKKKSKEERQIREQIKGLRRYIKDYSLLSEKEEITEISLWEDYFILAIALGLNKKVINKWYEYGQNFTESNLETSLYNVGGYTYMATTMMPVFRSYSLSTYNSSSGGYSSYSGSSGGFSGGSSSGGGGRRWRRRKFFLSHKKNLLKEVEN